MELILPTANPHFAQSAGGHRSGFVSLDTCCPTVLCSDEMVTSCESWLSRDGLVLFYRHRQKMEPLLPSGQDAVVIPICSRWPCQWHFNHPGDFPHLAASDRRWMDGKAKREGCHGNRQLWDGTRWQIPVNTLRKALIDRRPSELISTLSLGCSPSWHGSFSASVQQAAWQHSCENINAMQAHLPDSLQSNSSKVPFSAKFTLPTF